MNTVYKRIFQIEKLLSDKLVGTDHERLDYAVRKVDRICHDVINGAVDAIANADTLIIGGTSLIVYPAAGLIRYFRGNNIVLINKTATTADANADLVIHDSLGKVFEQIKVN